MRWKTGRRTGAVATVVATLAFGCGLLPRPELGPTGPLVTRAAEWDALFEREVAGAWAGGDGAYSVSLPGAAATLFLFGDTLVAENGKHLLVRNTLARLDGNRPDAEAIEFLWRRGPDGLPRAALAPLATGDWYWPQHGVVIDGTVNLFVLRMTAAEGGGHFDFRIRGAELLSFPERQALPPAVVVRRAVPSVEAADGSPVVFGAAVLAAGDPYLYVYGWKESPGGKELLVARVPAPGLDDFDAWGYWDGRAWVGDARRAAPVADRLSAELGVVGLPDGRFVLVHQLDGVGHRTVARVARSPAGPFGPPVPLWDCPEAELVDVYCYNAKPHPALSAGSELLVSYNVNVDAVTVDPEALASIYRPRFLRVPLALLDEAETEPPDPEEGAGADVAARDETGHDDAVRAFAAASNPEARGATAGRDEARE